MYQQAWRWRIDDYLSLCQVVFILLVWIAIWITSDMVKIADVDVTEEPVVQWCVARQMIDI
jgi:hypothetical protein